MNTISYIHKPQSGKTTSIVYDTNSNAIPVMWFDKGDRDHEKTGFYTFVPKQQIQQGTNYQQENQSLYQWGSVPQEPRVRRYQATEVPHNYSVSEGWEREPLAAAYREVPRLPRRAQQAAAAPIYRQQHLPQDCRFCDRNRQSGASYCSACKKTLKI